MQVTTQLKDRRRQRTRRALLAAFGELATERRYEDIRIADIVGRAAVGRSTFYDHYRGKSQLLAEATSGLFGVLADSIWKSDHGDLEHVLRHFWDNRRLAGALLDTAPSRPLTRTLADAVGERLTRHGCMAPGATRRMIALQIAGGQLTLLRSWLGGELRCNVRELAQTMARTSSSAARSSLRGQGR